MRKVFVSGSFDVCHAGHVAFLEQASKYGELYVGIGSDKSINRLKGRETVCKAEERLYMVRAIRYVEDAWINSGDGTHDFFEDIVNEGIDVLVVNEDQDTEDKRLFCFQEQIEYIVLKRIPAKGLPKRSSTEMRQYYGK